MNDKKYIKFLDGKKVVIVGPSWHISKIDQLDLINSYDVVVRMNIGYRIPEKIKKCTGDRIDILYCSLNDYYIKNDYFTKKIMKKLSLKLKWITLTHVGLHKAAWRELKKVNKNIHIPIHLTEKKHYNFLFDKTKKKLSCGIVAIYDLLKYNIKQLYVTGFTFYDVRVIGRRKTYYSGYNKNNMVYSKRPVASHSLNAELRIFKKMQKSDNRLICDDILKKIIKQGRIASSS